MKNNPKVKAFACILAVFIICLLWLFVIDNWRSLIGVFAIIGLIASVLITCYVIVIVSMIAYDYLKVIT